MIQIYCTTLAILTIAAAVTNFLLRRRATRHLWAEVERLKNELQLTRHANLGVYRNCWSYLASLMVDKQEPIRFCAQNGEDIILWNFFGRRTQGFFVEIGAYNGISLSNTYAFAKMGWAGLLVEASPSNYALCLQNRPESIVVHSAVAECSSESPMVFNQVVGPPGVDTLSFVEADEKHLARIRREGGEVQQVRVPVRSLDDIIAEISMPRSGIDFMTIDVEGLELDVLKGFSLDKYPVRVVILESNDRESSLRLEAYMKKQGYRRALVIEGNHFYCRADESAAFECPWN